MDSNDEPTYQEKLMVSEHAPPALNETEEQEKPKVDKKSTLAAFFSLLISIPALIGS